MALVPHAMTFASNNTWDAQLMEITDLRATATPGVSWGEFTGATVVRVVGSIFVQPTWPSPGADNAIYTQYYHFGIGMSQDNAIEEARWDPNLPFADFMWRDGILQEILMRDAGNANMAMSFRGNPAGKVDFDISVKRKVRESDRLWLTGRMFAPNNDFGGAIGYSGRVLFLLP